VEDLVWWTRKFVSERTWAAGCGFTVAPHRTVQKGCLYCDWFYFHPCMERLKQRVWLQPAVGAESSERQHKTINIPICCWAAFLWLTGVSLSFALSWDQNVSGKPRAEVALCVCVKGIVYSNPVPSITSSSKQFWENKLFLSFLSKRSRI
jgi:hypothetical protein